MSHATQSQPARGNPNSIPATLSLYYSSPSSYLQYFKRFKSRHHLLLLQRACVAAPSKENPGKGLSNVWQNTWDIQL